MHGFPVTRSLGGGRQRGLLYTKPDCTVTMSAGMSLHTRTRLSRQV
jgi:hypothetical protein